MEPLAFEQRVIAAAELTARSLDENPNDLVASVALDTEGRVHTALNNCHGTNASCAAALLAAADRGPLVALAAAGNHALGLVALRRDCCEVVDARHPDILVAVPTALGPRMRPVANLLPGNVPVRTSGERVLRFNKGYYDSVSHADKTSTVRWDEPVSVGPAIFYFEDDDRPALRGRIVAVHRYALDELTPERLRLGDGDTVAHYVERLRQHYPAMPATAEVDVVDFVVAPSVDD